MATSKSTQLLWQDNEKGEEEKQIFHLHMERGEGLVEGTKPKERLSSPGVEANDKIPAR